MAGRGNHSLSRSNVAHAACKAYKESIDNYIREAMKKTCQTIVHDAVYWRRGHNYTGNLINSICGGVYEKGKLIYDYYSYKTIGKLPIRTEMTASKNLDKETGAWEAPSYYFAEDWDGEESAYVPETKTDMWYGQMHALEFIRDYHPTSKYFEIVIAYTADYAAFVDREHGTLGYDKALQDFESALLDFQRHAEKGTNWSSTRYGWHVVLKSVNVTK